MADLEAAIAAEEANSCEKSFFEEHGRAKELVHAFTQSSDPLEMEQHLEALIIIIDKYMEQSYLLDAYLQMLLTPVMDSIKNIMISAVASSTSSDAQAFPYQIYKDPKLHKLCQWVYQLCRVRGHKTIVKVLPHEVADFEPALFLLQSQDKSDHSTWETRYVLLLWLAMLCLVPFDLSSIDSSSVDPSSTSIVDTILTLCKGYLSDPGPTQIAASICLGRLLSRPDMENDVLDRFLQWANQELAVAVADDDSDASVVRAPRASHITGIMQTLAHIVKNSPRDKHHDASRVYFTRVLQLSTKLAEEADDPNPNIYSSTVHRKFSVKLVQRLGLLYLPPKVRSWRYQRGVRSLELNMESAGIPNASVGKSQMISNTTSTVSQSSNQVDEKNDQEEEQDVENIEELEQIVEVLLSGLRDKDTVVRWSAAKGVGRITGRLPYAFADDIVQAVLELFVATEGDASWHGASLAVAELARRGVLLPQRLPEATNCVARALGYDVRRGNHSVGAHVRDAACYSCWSFARAYDPHLLLPYLEKVLAPAMLTTCVFDRELNCRRAASAAFQECVGRQGRENFPHGIDLLTNADYFAVANLRHAYLDVSVFVASFPEYRYFLLDHLLSAKTSHWHVSIRQLAAKALGQISALDLPYTMSVVLPRLLAFAVRDDVEVIARHGAVLSIAEVLSSLTQVCATIDGEIQKKVKTLALDLDKKRLFRGRGGEMVRLAICRVIESIAIARLGLSFPLVKKYLAILEECFCHATEHVRRAAIDAFAVFTRQYCAKILLVGKDEHKKFLQSVLPHLMSSGIKVNVKEGGKEVTMFNLNMSIRRGCLRAIGVASKEMVGPVANECAELLFEAADVKRQDGDEADAESRVEAIKAIEELFGRTGEDTIVELRGVEGKAVETLIRCIHDDYSVDDRGDVGSWIRKQAMISLEKLLLSRVTGVAALVDRRVSSLYGEGNIRQVVPFPRHVEDEPTDPMCLIQFEKPAFGYYYFPFNGSGYLRLSHVSLLPEDNDNDKPFVLPTMEERERLASMNDIVHGSSPVFVQRIPPALVSDYFNALFKQLSEKLDNLRQTAGQILFRLLHSSVPRIDGIPDRMQLEKQIYPPTLQVNWSMAKHTFPLVVRTMDIPEYMESIASGLVLSVGGLTESVVSASEAALFGWIRGHRKNKNMGLLTRFFFFLISLFSTHQGDDRVVIPLMKTIAKLFDNDLVDFLYGTKVKEGEEQVDVGEMFGNKIYDALKGELQKSASVTKLSAGIQMLVALLPSCDSTEAKALKALSLFLGHRFPRIRKMTAEMLYTRLVVEDELVDESKYEQVLELLSETAWDAPIGQAREARNQLLDLLGLERPKQKASVKETSSTSDGNVADDSYKTLVKEMGY